MHSQAWYSHEVTDLYTDQTKLCLTSVIVSERRFHHDMAVNRSHTDFHTNTFANIWFNLLFKILFLLVPFRCLFLDWRQGHITLQLKWLYNRKLYVNIFFTLNSPFWKTLPASFYTFSFDLQKLNFKLNRYLGVIPVHLFFYVFKIFSFSFTLSTLLHLSGFILLNEMKWLRKYVVSFEMLVHVLWY